MAGTVGSTLLQDAMSRAVSTVLSNPERKASKRHMMERVEMAHAELEFALERSCKLPITDESLLRQRRMVKRAYDECGDVLLRSKMRLVEEDHQKDDDDQRGVVTRRIASALPRRIFHAVRLFISSSVSLEKDHELTASDVTRFEWFADKAGKFVRDVETGRSLSHYRFVNPLMRRLLARTPLYYEKLVRGSHSNRLLMSLMWSEERGAEAWVWFTSKGHMTPTNTMDFRHVALEVVMTVHLSESMDIVGITTTCFHSFAPLLDKPFAEAAVWELAELTTNGDARSLVRTSLLDAVTATDSLPHPTSCNAEHVRCARDVVTLSSEFPVEVSYVCFGCSVRGTDEHCVVKSSSDDAAAGRSAARYWPLRAFSESVSHGIDVIPCIKWRKWSSERESIVSSIGMHELLSPS